MRLTGRFTRLHPEDLRAFLLTNRSGQTALEFLRGRRPDRRCLEEFWRLWPTLSLRARHRARDLHWETGLTTRLIAAVAGARGSRRQLALARLRALTDPRSLGPLVMAWPRLLPTERRHVLSLAGQAGHPGLAGLIWRQVAQRAHDPFAEMVRLVQTAGAGLIDGVGRALTEPVNTAWAWETLLRLGPPGEVHLLACLGRDDALGDRARRYFAEVPGERTLAILMQTARDHESRAVRAGAVTALANRKEPQVLRFLTELLNDRSWYIKLNHTWPSLFGVGASRPIRSGAVLPAPNEYRTISNKGNEA